MDTEYDNGDNEDNPEVQGNPEDRLDSQTR